MRDYARRSRPVKKHSRPDDGRWILIFLAICTLAFAGYVINHFFHQKITQPITQIVKTITTHKSKPIKHKITIAKPKKSIKEKQKMALKKATPKPTDDQPKYDFYQLLPKLTVNVPTPDQSNKTHSSH